MLVRHRTYSATLTFFQWDRLREKDGKEEDLAGMNPTRS